MPLCHTSAVAVAGSPRLSPAFPVSKLSPAVRASCAPREGAQLYACDQACRGCFGLSVCDWQRNNLAEETDGGSLGPLMSVIVLFMVRIPLSLAVHSEQTQFLNELSASLDTRGASLIVEYNSNLHDRSVEFNNGWVVRLGRGLDYFKPVRYVFLFRESGQYKEAERLLPWRAAGSIPLVHCLFPGSSCGEWSEMGAKTRSRGTRSMSS